MEKPTLYVVAGANGSGKSTIINRHKNLIKDINFVNPDDIAASINSDYDGKDNALTRQAGKEAIKQQNDLLKERKTFGIETTFSGKRELRIMQQAKNLGYEVKLAYVGLNNLASNIERVNERTRNGGHFVDPETIVRRYNKSMNTNLEKGIKLADKTYIIDNTKNKDYIVAKFQSDKVLSVTNKEIPSWVKNKADIYKKIETHQRYQKALEKIIEKRDQNKSIDRGIERWTKKDI